MKLYAHPFSSYSQKVLIALYENATLFEYRNLEEPAASAELAALWPLKRFPVLLDDGRCILESSTIVAHLQAHHPDPVSLIPPGDAGLEVHMLDRVFDNYVMTPMQKVVLDALRPAADRDRYGVAEAREMLNQIYPWLDQRLEGRHWIAGADFTLADCAAAPRSSTPTGPTRSRLAMATCVPIAPVCSIIPPSCGWWRRRGHFVTTSRWARQRVIERDDLWWASIVAPGNVRGGQGHGVIHCRGKQQYSFK